jgi:hypothetical protein
MSLIGSFLHPIISKGYVPHEEGNSITIRQNTEPSDLSGVLRGMNPPNRRLKGKRTTLHVRQLGSSKEESGSGTRVGDGETKDSSFYFRWTVTVAVQLMCQRIA